MRSMIDIARIWWETRLWEYGREDGQNGACLGRNRQRCRRDDDIVVLVENYSSRGHNDGEWDIGFVGWGVSGRWVGEQVREVVGRHIERVRGWFSKNKVAVSNMGVIEGFLECQQALSAV